MRFGMGVSFVVAGAIASLATRPARADGVELEARAGSLTQSFKSYDVSPVTVGWASFVAFDASLRRALGIMPGRRVVRAFELRAPRWHVDPRVGVRDASVYREVTVLVHGGSGLDSALRITAALFAGTHADLQLSDFEQLRLDGLPTTRLESTDLMKPLTTLLAESGAAASGKQVKDALSRSAVTVNGRTCSLEDNNRAQECFAPERAAYGRFYLLRLGKKNFHLFDLAR